ncbi:GspE/PulE family protein [Tundrisphaera sp. TA3]|uniref:GspE/PulE family protein n=1 Tax=Tundrisphaera sp. TA3 TaxID=3435775 RepID=UPI003EBF9E21
MSAPPSTDRLPAATELALGAVLVQDGLLSAAQLLAVQQYGAEHHLDLLQSITKLKMVDEGRIRGILVDRIPLIQPSASPLLVTSPAPATDHPLAGPTPPAASPQTPVLATTGDHPPDLAQRELDIRDELKAIAATAGSPDLVAQIFDRAFETRATDIHFDPQDACLRVRFRIDGQLHDVLELDTAYATSLVSRIKLLADLNIVERRHSQDGRIRLPHGEKMRDLRVATLPTIMGEKIVVRVHETIAHSYGFDTLGLTSRETEQLSNICTKPYGCVLVAGPVGAGKTTTLYTCLNRVNSPTRNVMTIEDPIEHRLPGLNQTQVDSRNTVGFSEGLKAMLRQDPDVIMIGEIRDEETAHIGIRAAMTGVLVFSTIHASDAPGTIGNLYDFKIPGYLLSNTLLAIISQRLLRKICPYCKVEYLATEQHYSMLGLDPADHPDLTLSRGEGCSACFQTGYLGRSGIFEIMEIGEVLRELIFQQISKDVLRRVAIDLGMRTLRQNAVDKVLEGATTVEEVYRVVAM